MSNVYHHLQTSTKEPCLFAKSLFRLLKVNNGKHAKSDTTADQGIRQRPGIWILRLLIYVPIERLFCLIIFLQCAQLTLTFAPLEITYLGLNR